VVYNRGMQQENLSGYWHGIELFNARQYYEAHEAWEDVWRVSEGDERKFYQGLIQAAAAMVHHTKGNLRGIEIVLPKALDKLESLPRIFMSLDLEKFTKELRNFLAYAIAGEQAAEQDPARPHPTIELLK
jgi:uncharacterized protein